MSGTRKMEKFEIDAFAKTREEELASKKGEQLESQAAAAIAELQPGSALDALDAPNADLPARTFEPRADAGAGGADLPALPFEPRLSSGGPGAADLPAVPFERRAARDEGTDAASTAAPSPGSASGQQAGARQDGVEQPGTPGAAWVPGEWIPPQQAEPAPGADGANANGEQDVEALRTRLARKFVTLADSVTEAFKELAIGAGAYAVELTAPQGMSTGGGKQALQHLRLRPRREGYSVLVAGTVNQVERRAELRDYDHLAILNEVRFRQPIDISQQEWEQFLRKAEVVLNGAGIQSMRTPPPRELLDQRRSMQRVSKGAVAALVIVLLLAAVVVWRVLVAVSSG